MADMYDRFKRLSAERGMYMSDCAKEIGITPSTISNWKRRNAIPNGDLVVKMAEYFGCSTDRILGVEKADIHDEFKLSSEELELLNAYNDLSFNEQNMIRRMLNLKEKEISKSSEVV